MFHLVDSCLIVFSTFYYGSYLPEEKILNTKEDDLPLCQ